MYTMISYIYIYMYNVYSVCIYRISGQRYGWVVYGLAIWPWLYCRCILYYIMSYYGDIILCSHIFTVRITIRVTWDITGLYYII